MIKLFSLISLIIPLSLFSQTTVWDSLQHQLQWRNYKIHIPPTYTSLSSIPLVIALHGGGHNADTMEYISNLSLKADSSNFIVVYPNGRSFLGLRTWNAGTCCGPAVTYNVDDVGFIMKMLNKLKSQYNIDTNRIYVTGASNGGMLAYRLACEKGHLFAAIAPVATTMVTTISCTPLRTVPILHIHSLPDTRVPYTGGYGTGYAGVYMPPIDSVMDVWANIDSCQGTWNVVFNHNGVVGKGWSNCSNCSEVYVYTTSDGGHSWPGGNQTANGDPPALTLNATDLMWTFFSSHSLNCTPSSINNDTKINNEIRIYPNPTSDFLNMIVPYEGTTLDIIIYNYMGEICFKMESYNNKSLQIPLNKLSKGIYLLSVYRENKMITNYRFVLK